MAELFLALAILVEVASTLCFHLAVHSSARWYLVVAAGYVVALCLLALTLREGMGLGPAYGVWAASGVALTAIASRYLFDEPMNRLKSTGILLVVAGVLLVELGTVH